MEVKVYRTKSSLDNLCDTCTQCFANCEVSLSILEFGNAPGEDNVIQCDMYTPEEVLPGAVECTSVEV